MDIQRLGKEDVLIAQAILNNLNIEMNEASLPRLNDLLANECCYVLAALHSGVILGFLLAYRFPSFYANENTAYLYDIEVWPPYRQQGIGRQLIEALMNFLQKDQVKEVWLGTGVDNKPAQRLFMVTGAEREVETFLEYIYYL